MKRLCKCRMPRKKKKALKKKKENLKAALSSFARNFNITFSNIFKYTPD